jgi:hypothetical protein
MSYINSTPCLALVDTGSQVTTVSGSFQKECLPDCLIQQLNDNLRIEGAGGQDVPFLGFIEAEVSFPEKSNSIIEKFDTVVLVVPNTNFIGKYRW